MGLVGAAFGIAALVGISDRIELEFFEIELNDTFGRVLWALGCLALAGVGFSGFLGFRYAARDRRLISGSLSDKDAEALKITVLPEPVAALITIPLAFVGPWAWEIGWLVMLPLGVWLRRRFDARYAEED